MEPYDGQAKIDDRRRERQRTVNAYHRALGGADGATVLDDLVAVFGLDRPAFLAKPNGGYDPLHGAIRDGQRSVILHIWNILKLPAKGDNEVEEGPKVLS